MNKIFEYVNFSYLEEISGGDDGFKKDLIQIFLNQIPEFVSNMHQFLSEKKYELLAREAHTAKSSVLIFMMEESGSKLKQIQLLAEENDIEPIPELLSEVETKLEGAQEELSSYLETLD
jgi:HPt (histidine-containing phosphotransfer) domain-containing protein